MTSRRAQRRELERRGVATLSPATGSALAAAIGRAPGSVEPEHERTARLARDAEWAELLARNFEAGDPARVGFGLKAWREVARVEVPADLRRDMVPGAGAPLACYQVALWYVAAHADHDPILVHGAVIERGRFWWHCWCEIDGEIVFDPTTGLHFDRASWDDVLQPVRLASFTATQAAARAAETGTAGPWPLDEGGAAALVGAVAELFGQYAMTHPDVVAWVGAMRERDASFARDFDRCVTQDVTALVDLLHDLMEHPAKWRGHDPGAPWPYRFGEREQVNLGG